MLHQITKIIKIAQSVLPLSKLQMHCNANWMITVSITAFLLRHRICRTSLCKTNQYLMSNSLYFIGTQYDGNKNQ